MSIWKKLFGTPVNAVQSDLETYIEVTNSTETRRIEALVNEAQEYYPHKNPAKALSLFRLAIQLTSPAPASKSVQKSRDHSSTGDAFWMAWVCLDMLNRPPSETDDLLAEARIKSPVTAARIEERLAEAKEKANIEHQIKEAFATIKNEADQDVARVQNAVSILIETGDWWDLRDAGLVLIKQRNYDLAWEILNSALTVAMKKAGNIPSIYLAIGDLKKTQQLHREACRYYLLSCLNAGDAPLKRAVDQLRISLKKAGGQGDHVALCDELLGMGRKFDESAIIARLNSYLSSGANDE